MLFFYLACDAFIDYGNYRKMFFFHILKLHLSRVLITTKTLAMCYVRLNIVIPFYVNKSITIPDKCGFEPVLDLLILLEYTWRTASYLHFVYIADQVNICLWFMTFVVKARSTGEIPLIATSNVIDMFEQTMINTS